MRTISIKAVTVTECNGKPMRVDVSFWVEVRRPWWAVWREKISYRHHLWDLPIVKPVVIDHTKCAIPGFGIRREEAGWASET